MVQGDLTKITGWSRKEGADFLQFVGYPAWEVRYFLMSLTLVLYEKSVCADQNASADTKFEIR